ncbi:DNA-binding transcriptional ArsR family regulator [Sphingobium sp. OAS761]|uniref:ArsR/SmtB family transcription factor n=1 Tax=Sphingobium sp. OAS761 TaxID=2817901 RepID=UPI00209F4665|nr:metalloregulator ArsR/SmtB family transcription factor [Sphingobium sp. OAS761]MCP1472143.1 DNA-binding transcriptional ArsR family regulator [Sphingobium sp. OAS761]
MKPAFYEDRETATIAAEKLKIFAQPQRLMILSCLLRGERNVSEIGEATEIVQPALSQQLGELRRADLVQTRKEAKLVWYALADEGVALCVRTMEAIFGGVGKVEDQRIYSKPIKRPPSPEGVAGFAQIID